MNLLSKLSVAFKAVNQLGPEPVALNALYRFGLATGHYRRTESKKQETAHVELKPLFKLPDLDKLSKILGPNEKKWLLAEADEILAGKVRLFGGDPVDLRLAVGAPLAHWTEYEAGKVPLPLDQLPVPDVKFLWEPARFGWAFTLGRAYRLTGDDKYPHAFWRFFETFADSNPPYLGPHWTSGQEVALRLMAFAWAAQVFADAPASTPERMRHVARSIAEHAARIPLTLVYARSQQNNHLLSEAAGLLTAGLAMPDHPESLRWQNLGWKWLNRGLQSQIDGYGEYAQHSANYQRLMLQIVLWSEAIRGGRFRWPRRTNEAIKRSVHWLLSLLDADSGRVPNLGANDGAYIFPMSISPFADYRPVLHAAARAFLDYDLPHGPWDELSLWFGIPTESPRYVQLPRYLGDQLYGKNSWASLRTAQYTTRPSHADQLHVDLWRRGRNIAQDAGTYLYNADPPWDNSLTTAFMHNTVTINGRDQMTRAGRFLYLDWIDAYRKNVAIQDPSIIQSLCGCYRLRGFRHTRTVSAHDDGRWRVTDEIIPLKAFPGRQASTFRLHWLLPDWEWKLDGKSLELSLKSPEGPVKLILHHSADTSIVSLARAGEILAGAAAPDPARGWVSPTYGVKVPALSLAVEVSAADDVQFISEFIFP